MRTSFLTVCALAAVACAHPQPAALEMTGVGAGQIAGREDAVTLETGQVRGASAGNVIAYKGIPYARPPVGPLRFREPERALPWTGVREAKSFGPPCTQAPSADDPEGTPNGGEDCLTLNVWAPKAPGPLPVFVFVHGGFFTFGSSAARMRGTDIYDGTNLARLAPAVVVTLNYRLGAFGWVGHPAFAAESPRHASGDYGLLDQIAALGWVQRNIGAFGGDPSHVVLMGQSAGAISAAALYASPRARGLFSAAILHSGNGGAMTRDRVMALGTDLARGTGCDVAPDPARCMRSKTDTEILAALPEKFGTGRAFGPAIDGDVLTASPLEMIRHGAGAGTPLLVSTTKDETSTMVRLTVKSPLRNEDDLRAAVARMLPRATEAQLRAVFDAYPLAAYPGPTAAYVAIGSDVGFHCPSNALALAASANAPGRVFRAVFAHRNEGPTGLLGAGHGMDLLYVFRNAAFYDFRRSRRETLLADEILSRWTAFAKTGVPDAPGLEAWPAYAQPNGGTAYLELDTPSAVRSDFHADKCRMWESIRLD